MSLLASRFILFFSLVSALSLSACGSDNVVQTYKPAYIKLDTLRIAQIYHLNEDESNPFCSIKLSYIFPVEVQTDSVLAKLWMDMNFSIFEDAGYETMSPQKAMEEYVNNYITNYKEEVQAGFGKWEESEAGVEYYSFYKRIDSKVIYNGANILSYQVKHIDQKAAKISSETYQNMVIDIQTGTLVTQDTIFVKEYEIPLSQLLKEELMKMYKAKTVDDLLAIGFYDVEEISPNSNFYADEKGLTFIYNEREIGNVALGESCISLTYKKLSKLLKPNSPISTLSGI